MNKLRHVIFYKHGLHLKINIFICQVQVESLRQELSDKQSLLSEAGEAIEQLETKISLQEDLNNKVIRHSQLRM